MSAKETMLAELEKQERWINAEIEDKRREILGLDGRVEFLRHLRARIENGIVNLDGSAPDTSVRKEL